MDRKLYIDKIEEAFLKLEKGAIYRSVIGDAERLLIEKALERSCGNQIAAAEILGVNRNTLRTKIRKLRINVTRFKS